MCSFNLFDQEHLKRQLIEEEEEHLTALPAQRFPLAATGGAPFIDQQQEAEQAEAKQPADDLLADAVASEEAAINKALQSSTIEKALDPSSEVAADNAVDFSEAQHATGGRKGRFL